MTRVGLVVSPSEYGGASVGPLGPLTVPVVQQHEVNHVTSFRFHGQLGRCDIPTPTACKFQFSVPYRRAPRKREYERVIDDLFGILLEFSIGERLAKRRRVKKAAEARSHYGKGAPVSISASVLGIGGIPSRWTAGVLDVEPALLTWYGGFKRRNAGIRLPGDDVAIGEPRDVTPAEGWSLTQECVVVPVDFREKSFELALFPYDLPMVRDAVAGRAELC